MINKYGTKNLCRDCVSIGLSTDKEPCFSCRMIEIPSNYEKRKFKGYLRCNESSAVCFDCQHIIECRAIAASHNQKEIEERK